MKSKLVFATHNQHKLREVSSILNEFYEVVGLNEINCFEDIPETAVTLQGNAELKSNYVYTNYKLNCFSDDTGLEVEALQGAPGVYSARYAGDECSDQKNVEKLLAELEGVENRSAQFKTVVSLIIDGEHHCFEGVILGHISTEKAGANGFGYDPVFIPDGYNKTFAELSDELKNRISHRALAIKELARFLHKRKQPC